MNIPNFFYHPRMLEYDFGKGHPLKPERLRRTIELLHAMGLSADSMLDPGAGLDADVLRLHDPEYVHAVADLGSGLPHPGGFALKYGFGTVDCPIFPGMHEASLAYVSGSIRAAQAVNSGAKRAFNIAGGLHHGQRARASGFCIYNDPALALHALLERFERVAYVDIDVHHGDGVQALWLDDPRVLTCSIHQDGKTLYPGTGAEDETGVAFTSLNVPLQPGTTGDVWLWSFEHAILPALERFGPQAIVLQMGTDPHWLDPLAHLKIAAQDWLSAVKRIHELDLPVVAVGGGGYNLTTVPRMWIAAILTLSDIAFDDKIPEPFASEWHMPTFFDEHPPGPSGSGMPHAQRVVRWLEKNLLPNLPAA